MNYFRNSSQSAPALEQHESQRRAISYPLNVAVVLLAVAAVNAGVWFAGEEWFVQLPSLFVPLRNVLLVLLLLVGGGLLMKRHDRRAELFLLTAALLFGIGLAMQFRLGHDAPRQLSPREIELASDTIRAAMPGAPEDTLNRAITREIRTRNALLRRDFEQARIDVRLARSLDDAYGPSDTTSPFLQERTTAPTDPIFFRLLPVLAFLTACFLFARTRLPATLSSQWKLIGLYGSLGLCLVTFLYLTTVGGIRGSTLSPQELLKVTIPIAWAGLLLQYRNVFLADRLSKMTDRPVVLWLYVLALLALPLVVFVAVRDFGQFLAIGVAQILLLAWYTRRSLYVLLFGSGLVVAAIVLLGDSITVASPLVLVIGTIALTVLLLAALERFQRNDVLWPTASIVLAGFGLITWGATLLPFVREMLETPRSRFLLWADLYGRHGNPDWWDNSRQVIEALYSFDAGGLLGTGIGQGSPFLIPKAGSDFIFAAFVEETGLIGGLLILLAIAGLVVIGLRIALDQGRGSFLGLLLGGYVMLLGGQSFVHIAGTMNLMPMTGITLPLLSSGMSSLVVSWGIVGIIVGLASRDEPRKGEEFTVRTDLQGTM